MNDKNSMIREIQERLSCERELAERMFEQLRSEDKIVFGQDGLSILEDVDLIHEADELLCEQHGGSDVHPCFVTDGTSFLVQIPAENAWGFVLADEDQTWPGGFGSGMTTWRVASQDEVPQEVRERLGWLLEEQPDLDILVDCLA